MTDWIAVCAPGRKMITDLNTLFWDEHVVEVQESPVIEGDTVVLINADLERELQEQLNGMSFEFAPDMMPYRARPGAVFYWPGINVPGDGWKITGSGT